MEQVRRSAGRMPRPAVGDRDLELVAPCRARSIAISAPGSPYLAAFEIRLPSTCSMRAGSMNTAPGARGFDSRIGWPYASEDRRSTASSSHVARSVSSRSSDETARFDPGDVEQVVDHLVHVPGRSTDAADDLRAFLELSVIEHSLERIRRRSSSPPEAAVDRARRPRTIPRGGVPVP